MARVYHAYNHVRNRSDARVLIIRRPILSHLESPRLSTSFFVVDGLNKQLKALRFLLYSNVSASIVHRGKNVSLPGIVTFRGPSVAVLVSLSRSCVVRVPRREPCPLFVYCHQSSCNTSFAPISSGLLDETYTVYAAHCPEMHNARAEGLVDEDEAIANVPRLRFRPRNRTRYPRRTMRTTRGRHLGAVSRPPLRGRS